MRSDWNDGPRRKRSKKKQRETAIAVIFYSVLGIGCAYLAAPLLTIKVYEGIKGAFTQHEPRNPPYEQPIPQRPQIQAPVVEQQYQAESTLTDEDFQNAQKNAELYWHKPRNGNAGERQTVFNDSNYAPPPTINTMESRHVTIASRTQNPAPQSRTVNSSRLNGTSQVILKWRDARGRESRWPTAFSYRNSQIDNDSFCKNYRSGSIDYRTCRKAAKEWLNGQCGSGNRVQGDWQRMYCLAANGFRT